MTVQSMLLLVAPVLLGVVVGYLVGGRLTAVPLVRVRALWLLWVAVAIQATQYYVDSVRRIVEVRLGVPMLALVFATVAVWLAVNFRVSTPLMRVGMSAILLGAASNAIAIAANGRMPYSLTAAAAAGLPAGAETPKNEPAGPTTRLAVLGDVIAVAPLRKVVSPGDLLIAAGSAVAVAAAMRRRHRTEREEVDNDQYHELAAGAPRGIPAGLDRDAAVHDRRAGV